METYQYQDVKRYTDAIREQMNRQSSEMTDAAALELIERFVFSQPKSGSCTSRQNSALIRRLYGKRSEL